MNIHICPDFPLFDTFISLCEQCASPGENMYLVTEAAPLSAVKSSRENVTAAPIDSDEFVRLVGDLSAYKKIFIHFLQPRLFPYLLQANTKGKLFWVFWGKDFYQQVGIEFPLYDQATRALFKEDENILSLNTVKQWVRPLRNRFKHRPYLGSVLKCFDYFMHFNPFEFDLIKQTFPGFKAQLVDFFYPFSLNFENIDQTLASLRTEESNAPPGEINILVGNSGDPSNNHLDVFELLVRSQIPYNQVLVPLSYGEEDYVKKITQAAERILGNKFHPLKEYLPLDQYLKTLNHAHVGIMNHNRTQAMGNIFLLLYLGKKVFLKKDNLAYRLIQSKGLQAYLLEELNSDNVASPLAPEQIAKNKEILSRMLSWDRAAENVRAALAL